MNDSTFDPNNCNIQAAINAGRALGSPIEQKSPLDAVVVHQNYRVIPLQEVLGKYAEEPQRTQVVAQLLDVESFVRYVTEYKGPATKIFACLNHQKSPQFSAVIDYHAPGEAAWCQHKAHYFPDFTPEWTRWMAQEKKKMNQNALASFVEENSHLIIEPSGADLLELVQDLEGKNNIACNTLIRLDNGRTKLNFEETVELKGNVSTRQESVEFPNRMVAQIQPFDGGPAYKISCRLRYRIESRALVFWFECVDVHLIIKDVISGIVDQIHEKTSIAPLLGAVA